MRFVAIKSPEQQAVLALHRVRDLIVRQRTQIVNMLRGVLAEFGIVVRQGAGHAIAFVRRCLEGTEQDLPDLARDVVTNLCHQLVALHRRVLWYGRQLNRAAAQDERVTRLRTIPGVGPITASAIAATVGDGRQFPRAAAASPPGSASRLSIDRAVAKSGSGASRRWGTAISEGCWCSA